MAGGFVPVAAAPGEFAEHEFGSGTARIHFQLFLELGARLVYRPGIARLGKQDLAQAVVHAVLAGVLLEDAPVNAGRLVPLALRFKSLGFQPPRLE